MTNEEQAIEYIKKYRELDEKLYNTAPKGTVSSIATKKCLEFWDMAIKALEQQPSDTVSRHVVKEQMIKYGFLAPDMTVTEFVENLPPVTPQQKYGKWIGHPEIETSAPEYLMFYECSECGDKPCFCKSDIHKKRFCSNCGCHMVEPQESEDKE